MSENGTQAVEKRSYQRDPDPAPPREPPAVVAIVPRGIRVTTERSLDPRQTRVVLSFIRGDQAHVEALGVGEAQQLADVLQGEVRKLSPTHKPKGH